MNLGVLPKFLHPFLEILDILFPSLWPFFNQLFPKLNVSEPSSKLKPFLSRSY
jgi:hypothetical protein